MNLKQIESEIKDLFLAGKIRFPCHLSGGNESELEEIFKEIKSTDWVFSTHRNHFHALLHGYPPEQLKEDIQKYGSMNIYKEKFFTSGIVGGILPIALGVALSIKLNGDKEHIWCFVGDMAGYTGIFHECITYASGYDLPITFVIEDNDYSVDTPTKEVWKSIAEGNISDLRYYHYNRIYPHQGSGVFVLF